MKRISFILLPLLAILITINCLGDNSVSFQSKAHDVTFTSRHAQVWAPYSVKLNKENNKESKNKIRIKAWDEYAALDIVPPCQSSRIVYSFHKPVYSAYDVYFQSVYISWHNLRGPPADNI